MAEGERSLDDVQAFTRVVAAGELVFETGESGDELFIVQSGQVDLMDPARGTTFTSIGPGGVVGELSFFEGRPREISARAAVETRLIRLDRPTFDRITTESPQIATAVARQLAHRVAEARTQVQVPAPAGAAAAAARPAPQGEPRLVAEEGGTAFPLDGLSEAFVGRPDKAAGFVPEVDLSALDTKRTLSRRHARIIRRGTEAFVVEETSSRNGTFVNGERLAAGREVPLRSGDRVQFGLVKLVFQWD
jgi:pSer/pThr/pTyr-binding forkhead associated (FHA) protein